MKRFRFRFRRICFFFTSKTPVFAILIFTILLISFSLIAKDTWVGEYSDVNAHFTILKNGKSVIWFKSNDYYIEKLNKNTVWHTKENPDTYRCSFISKEKTDLEGMYLYYYEIKGKGLSKCLNGEMSTTTEKKIWIQNNRINLFDKILKGSIKNGNKKEQ